MSLLLLAGAALVLWWPDTVAGQRLQQLNGRTRASSIKWPTSAAIWPLPLPAYVVGGPHAALSAMVIVGLTFRWSHRRRATHETENERRVLVRALSVMIAELSVGAPAVRACAAAADEVGAIGASSTANVLRVMVSRAELGGQVFADGIADDLGAVWQRVSVAWRAADDLGLPLADLLESVRADLLARDRFGRRTRAALAGPRATAAVLAGLPLLGVALGQLMGADPLGQLLGGGVGGILLVVGTVFAATGLVWSERITDRAVRQ